MVNNKLKIALVGCGRVSRTAHYDAIQRNDNFEFIAVCDTDKERADYWAGKNKVRSYYDINQLLEKEDLDIVTIASPSGLHFDLAMKVAQKKLHVIVEKPLAMRVKDARKLIETCKINGVKLFSVLQNRYNLTNLLLKQCIEKGRFGKLQLIHVNLFWNRALDYYTEDHAWRSKKDMAGGVFTNQAIHYVDMLQWLVDAPPSVAFAKMSNNALPVEVEQYGSAVIEFGNGAIASLSLSSVTFPEDLEGSITILGEKGTVRLDGKSMNKVSLWKFSEPSSEDEEIEKAQTSPPTVYGFGHFEFYRQVAKYLIDDDKSCNIINGEEGLKSVRLLEALYLSDSLNKQIDFSEVGL